MPQVLAHTNAGPAGDRLNGADWADQCEIHANGEWYTSVPPVSVMI
jgi:hypothetical protein